MEIDEGPPPFNGVVGGDDFENGGDEDLINGDVDTAISFGTLDHSHIADTSTMQSFSMSSVGQGDSMPDSKLKIPAFSEATSSSEVVTGKEPEETEDDDDDEWGDFGEASTKPDEAVQVVAQKEADDDEWGDFDQARGPPSRHQSIDVEPQQSFDDDDWQAEFSSAPKVELTSLKGLDEMLGDGEFFVDGFDDEVVSEFVSDLKLDDLRENLDREEVQDELWKSLRVVEEALSLKFEWKNSSTRGKHFKYIKIDENLVKTAPKSAFDMTNILLPTQPSTSNHHHNSNSNTSAMEPSISVESPSIPVVDFDWETSGLTNPLKGASQSSAIIDVDFLHSNGGSSYTNPLQKDLADFGLNSVSETVSGTQSNSSSSNILDSIMTKVDAGRKSPYKDSKVLSLDARHLLDQLPDLQYIQSNMLMFPMGSGTQNFPQ